MAEPVRVKSYIILDLETTGLPRIQLKTKITEISLLCIERSHISDSFGKKQYMPRVVHKLNLCVYPCKLINTVSSEVSGLTNDLLENCKRFDEDVFYMLQKMISILPQPVCILAHNGFRFDFPILRSEIYHIGKELSDDIYCADTLPAFRALLYKNLTSEVQDDEKLLDSEELSNLDTKFEDIETNLGIGIPADYIFDVNNLEEQFGIKDRWESQSWDEILNLATEQAEKQYIEEVQAIDTEELKLSNETTPKSKRNRCGTSNANVNGVVANGSKKTKEKKKQLFPDENLKPKRLSYRLGDCYEHLIGKKIVNAHRADSDTHALLECIVAIGPSFLEWVDDNCKPFNTINRLW